MEVISMEEGRAGGKYDEVKLLEAIKSALAAAKKTGKVAGFHLDALIKEVYSGDKPNLGALRKKVQEIGYKNGLGDVRVTIRENDNLIGFYIKK